MMCWTIASTRKPPRHSKSCCFGLQAEKLAAIIQTLCRQSNLRLKGRLPKVSTLSKPLSILDLAIASASLSV